LKSVDAFNLSPHVGRFAFDSDFKCDSSTVGIPYCAASRLGSEHSNGVLSEDSLRREVTRSARPGGFFIGYKDQANPPVQSSAALLQRLGGERHCRQTAFHVGRAATEKIVALNSWLKLRRSLCGNNIVMTAEIESPAASAHEAEDAFACYARIVKSKFIELPQNEFSRPIVSITGRIFCRDSDELLREFDQRSAKASDGFHQFVVEFCFCFQVTKLPNFPITQLPILYESQLSDRLYSGLEVFKAEVQYPIFFPVFIVEMPPLLRQNRKSFLLHGVAQDRAMLFLFRRSPGVIRVGPLR